VSPGGSDVGVEAFLDAQRDVGAELVDDVVRAVHLRKAVGEDPRPEHRGVRLVGPEERMTEAREEHRAEAGEREGEQRDFAASSSHGASPLRNPRHVMAPEREACY
jgi:sirohydrochlorin ferrochelatase